MYTFRAFAVFCALLLSCKSFELENELEEILYDSPTPPPDYEPHKDSNNYGINASVIIIGAGPSGIAAATKLLRNNFTNVKILEAENRIGGRVNSVKFGDQYVDLGAEFCHGEDDNVVYYMVKDLNVLRHFEGGVELYLSNGNKLDKDLKNKLFNFEHDIDASKNNEDTEKLCQESKSIGDCFDLKYDILLNETADEKEKEILEDAKTWLNNYMCSYDSNFDLDDLTRKSAYKKCDGDLYMNWNGRGYKTILEVMMGKFPNTSIPLPMDDKILLNKEVLNIKNWKDGNPIEVTTTEGETFTADHVIFTPSVGVLKADHEKLFNPLLPVEKVDAIKGIGYGAILKIMIKFPEPLQNMPNVLGTIWKKKDLEEATQKGFGWLKSFNGVTVAENNPRVLIGWYSAGNVTEIETLPDKEIMNGQKFIVEKFLKEKFGASEPEDFIRSSWYSNPHFRGTFSYESVEGHEKCGRNFQETLGKSLLNKDSKPTLLFAGEATHPYYFSTVHGAIETGYKQANKLINYYKTSQ